MVWTFSASTPGANRLPALSSVTGPRAHSHVLPEESQGPPRCPSRLSWDPEVPSGFGRGPILCDIIFLGLPGQAERKGLASRPGVHRPPARLQGTSVSGGSLALGDTPWGQGCAPCPGLWSAAAVWSHSRGAQAPCPPPGHLCERGSLALGDTPRGQGCAPCPGLWSAAAVWSHSNILQLI